MPEKETGTELEDGQPADDLEFEDEDDTLLTEGDEETEGSDDDEGQSDDDSEEDDFDYKKGYKEVQKAYNDSREELKEEKSQRGTLENQMVRFGGAEKAIEALDFISTDSDFRELAAKKSSGEAISKIDESKMSPQAKEALNTVRLVVKEALGPMSAEFDSKLRAIVEKDINPHTQAIKDVNLEHHIDKMTQKYGKEWLGQLDSMEKLKSTLPENARIAPTFKDIDRLYIESLREDGKFESFIIKQAKSLAKSMKDKTTKRHKSSGGTETTGKDKGKPPSSIIEAGRRVLAKQK